MTMDVPGYEDLAAVLTAAFDQAARGKGKERHANGRAFTDQPIFEINRMLPSKIDGRWQAGRGQARAAGGHRLRGCNLPADRREAGAVARGTTGSQGRSAALCRRTFARVLWI